MVGSHPPHHLQKVEKAQRWGRGSLAQLVSWKLCVCVSFLGLLLYKIPQQGDNRDLLS